MAAPPSSDNTALDSTINAETSKTESPDTLDSSSQSSSTATPEPGFGWTHYAEQINGRFAMVGFVALLLMELFTRQDFFTWVGLR